MGTIQPGSYLTREAGADLHTNQYCIAKIDSSNLAQLATAATDDIVGVLDEVPQGANGACSIEHVTGGNSTGKVKVGAALSRLTFITAGSGGKAVAATQTTGGSQPSVRVIGRLLEASTADGDIVEYEKMYFLY